MGADVYEFVPCKCCLQQEDKINTQKSGKNVT